MSNYYAGQKRQRRSTSCDTKDASTARIQAGFSNLGTGSQNNNLGPGTQYNATSINFVNKEKDSFLADIRVTDPRDDKTRIERTKGNLLRDSYRWIFDHNDFHKWREEKRLLWIKGGPGKGKTMLLCGLIDELPAMGYKSTFFFFCQAADARINTATSVLRGLLYMLLDQNPSVLRQIRDRYDSSGAGRQMFEDVNSWDVLCKMLISAVSHESLQDVVLVIDALDECLLGLDQLISFLVDLTTHVKIITSSRPEMSIDRGLAAALDDTKVYISLELNEDVISAAVSNYIHFKVDQLATLKGFDDEMKINIREYLALKANNTFLWAALVYEQLADNRVAKRHIETKLHEFPQGLNLLYNRILDLILESHDKEGCGQVLAIMSIVSRPLDLTELAGLLAHIEFLEDIVEECGSLLMKRGHVVYFIHQSAKEFLIGQAKRIMPLGMAHDHNTVLSKLLLTMSNTLRRNMYNIDEHGIPLEEIPVPNPDPLAPIRYGCVYWADHFIDGSVGKRQFDEVCTFIARHFLHWLEALSLLQCITEGISSLNKIQPIFETLAEPSEGGLLVQDAIRVIRYFRVGVEVDPMQVYLSVLIFSPMNGIMKGLFRDEQPKWPMKPVTDEDWSQCIQTIEGQGGQINSVDFSPDQTLLASASLDGTVKLWNTSTGHCIRTFNTHGEAMSVAFSIDGKTLAAASESLIEFWSTITGRHIRTLSSHGSCMSVAFSSDGFTLASGSNKNVVQLWDLGNGKCAHTLSGHRAAVLSVAFSGDGSSFASASHDKSVKLWQATTGICFKTIEHDNTVRSVAFSYDGTHVVSTSWAGVKVYNLVKNECFHPSETWGIRYTVAISHDGTQLAYDQRPGVCLWDMHKRRRIRTLDHNRAVYAVKFSADGSLLASGSYASIKLWNLVMDPTDSNSFWHKSKSPSWGKNIPSSTKSRTARMEAVANIVATAKALGQKAEGAVLGDTSEAVHDGVVNQHDERIKSVHFACGGSRVISTSDNKNCVWDTKDGNCLRTICVRNVQVADAATILNGNLRIAVIVGSQIEIRDGNNGMLLRVLEMRLRQKRLVVISDENPMSNGSICNPHPSILDFKRVQFSASGNELLTNFGTIDLSITGNPDGIPLDTSTPLSLIPSLEGYDWTVGDEGWILKDRKRFLWMPTEYRPVVADVSGSMVAMGLKSGRVSIMRFS